jgi:hypothetical protein
MLGSYKRNPKLHSRVYAEAPKDATHYSKNALVKFLKVNGVGEVSYFTARRAWTSYYNCHTSGAYVAAAEPLYLPTWRVNPYDVAIVDGATTAAPVYQTQQELLDENVSLENQVEKLQLQINKKKAFWEANARKITAWAVILDT